MDDEGPGAIRGLSSLALRIGLRRAEEEIRSTMVLTAKTRTCLWAALTISKP